MYITNKPEVASIAQKYGVDRIWIDLEVLGKEERQKNMDTVKSKHSIDDIRKIKPLLTSAEMLVRINPWNEKSQSEVQEVIEAGADIIMLPYWKSTEEVQKFVETVGGRCRTTLLLETKEAVEIIDEVLEISGIDEIHIGLNDLHLSYGMKFMFELLSNGIVDMLCNKFAKKNLPYGFGGIARIGVGVVPAEMIVQEHYRLGSTRAILSRGFCNEIEFDDIEKMEMLFKTNMCILRNYESQIMNFTDMQFENNRLEIKKQIEEIISS